MDQVGQDTAIAHPGLLRRGRRARPLPVRLIEPRRSGWLAALREAWDYRWCVSYFGLMMLRKRYRRTWLGIVWIPLKPGYNILSKILIFGGILGVATGNVPYPVFFLFANAAWYLFYETSVWSTRSLEQARVVLRRMEVPRLPVMVGAIVIGSADFLVYIAFAFISILWYWLRADVVYLNITSRAVLLPLGLVCLVMLGLGVGLLLSAAGARAKDVRYSLHWGLSFLMYVTPVLYPLSQIPPKWRPIAELNPVTGAVEMTKDGLFGSHECTVPAAIVTLIAILLLWIPGLWLYHRRDLLTRARRA